MADLMEQAHVPESPYPGIDPYRYADRRIFFGREAESRDLIRLIVMYRGVLLYSDSGNGKSSLINAGLVPLALEEGYQPQRIRVQPKPGQEIVIERLTERVDGESRFLPSIVEVDDRGERTIMALDRFLAILHQNAKSARPLLIFDQFEEWVTLFEETTSDLAAAEARALQARIRDAVVSLINDRALPVKVLISLREDYLAKLTPLFERCPSLPDQYLRLTPIDSSSVCRVIRGPFEEYPQRYPREIGSSLAQEIRTQFERRTDNGIHLTELQIVCRTLFESGKQGEQMEALFVEQGGVQGILEQYLAQALESLPSEQRDPAVCLLTRLVTSAGTRNVVSEQDLLSLVEHEDEIPRPVLSATLTNLERGTRLVRREARRDVYYYEIASEFLVDWIRRKAQDHQVRAEQKRLEKEHRAAEERRRARRQRDVRRILAGVSVVAILLAGFAILLARQARKEAEESHSRRFAQLAQLPGLEGDLRLLLALHAVSETYDEYHEVNPDAEMALRLALRNAGTGRRPSASPTRIGEFAARGSVLAAAFSPDGDRLATWNPIGRIRLVDAPSGRELATLVGRTERILAVAFSPSGDRVARATASLDLQSGKLVLWDAGSGQEVVVQQSQSGLSRRLTFSRDGARLAAVSPERGGVVEVWDASSGDSLWTRIGKTAGVLAAAFSPDGKRLTTVSRDGKVKAWDVSSSQELKTPFQHEERVSNVVFSLDGSRLATLGSTSVLKVRETESGREVRAIPLTSSPYRVTFSRDGMRLATVERDSRSGASRATVWDLSSGRSLLTVPVDPRVLAIAFAPDGRRLVAVGPEGTARVEGLPMGEIIDSARKLAQKSRRSFGQKECEDYAIVHSRQCDAARQMVKGDTLARRGKLEDAVAKYQAAQKLDSNLTFDPQIEARKFIVESLLAKGRREATVGYVDSALATFQEAMKLDPRVQNPKAAIARSLVLDGLQAASEGGLDLADTAFGRAQRLNPESIVASAWNELCWCGSLWGRAEDDACEQAVKLDPDNIHFRDSRGLARALAGDKQGAIEDFRPYVDQAEDLERRAQRRDWISALEKGVNPFSPAVLKMLSDQGCGGPAIEVPSSSIRPQLADPVRFFE